MISAGQIDREQPTLFTIGHSTRPLDELVQLLKSHGVENLVDIRTVPRSRFNPQFNVERLQQDLPSHGLGYRHFPQLGGLRKPLAESANKGWRNDSFRGFADYMRTEEFDDGLQDLMQLAQERPTAVMCAEAVPWRCHRSLVADALTVRGIKVQHILSQRDTKEHAVTEFAHIDGDTVTYPGPIENTQTHLL
jgi:uncharacterized protein (DUF488 family)